MNLQSQVALVTGASRGIGRAILDALGREGGAGVALEGFGGGDPPLPVPGRRLSPRPGRACNRAEMADTVFPAPPPISRNSGPSAERSDAPELPGHFPRTWATGKERNLERHSPTREGRGRTWAKAILLGEHSVVYGHPAVAVPLHGLL